MSGWAEKYLAEDVRDALNDAGYEQARSITEAEAVAAYRAVAAHSKHATMDNDIASANMGRTE